MIWFMLAIILLTPLLASWTSHECEDEKSNKDLPNNPEK